MGTYQQKRQSGFTVIELVFVGVFLAIAGVFIFIQMNNLKVANDDLQRKTAINAMYYALEEVYYKEHGFYPASLESSTLPSVDPSLFTDPDGFTLGKDILSEEELNKLIENGETSEDAKKRLASISAGRDVNYHYDATNCDTKNKCKSYTLRADMVGEAEYVKNSRHN